MELHVGVRVGSLSWNVLVDIADNGHFVPEHVPNVLDRNRLFT